MLRCRISSDLDAMQALHAEHSWVPGKEHIRPTEATLEAKRESMSSGSYDVNEWSMQLFGVKWEQAQLGRPFHFGPNRFPYNVPSGTHHYILWFPCSHALPDDAVSACCEQAVLAEGGSEFVWYINPKMTISAIWHVQVFWR